MGGDIRVTVVVRGVNKAVWMRLWGYTYFIMTSLIILIRYETISVTATLNRNVDITSSVNAER